MKTYNGGTRTARLTANLTPTMYRQIRALAILKGVSVGDLVIDALTPLLAENAAQIAPIADAFANLDTAIGVARKIPAQINIFDETSDK